MSQPQPAPYPYYSSHPPPPHSHDKYVGAIIVVGIVALIFGVVVGYGTGLGNGRTEATSSQPQQSSFTFTHGNVDIGTTLGDTPVSIFFDNQNTGTLASPIFRDNTYQLYLISGKTYQVTIYWYHSSTFSVDTKSCTARPQPFTPTGSDYPQNFLC